MKRRTIRGRRDYAILLLLVTYGLRAHEVAKLTLDDVDWKRERLQVLARKAGHATVYPLAGVAAEAIIDFHKASQWPDSCRAQLLAPVATRATCQSDKTSAAGDRPLEEPLLLLLLWGGESCSGKSGVLL